MKQAKLFLFILWAACSCVSKKQYAALQAQCDEKMVELSQTKESLEGSRNTNETLQGNLELLKIELENRQTQATQMQEQIDFLKETNTNLLDRLSDLSVVSKTGAESIKKSLETLDEQSKYIQNLTGKIQQKDSINLILVTNLKRSLDDINDEDIQIQVKKGVVYISISDKMLFRSASSQLNPRAKTVLGKVARVIKDHKDIDVLIEGHTDDRPISSNCIRDNWDLSALRAVSVVRFLQSEYQVRPERLTAAGRSRYVPIADNGTAEGRAANRRTEIIITPKLDQFFELLKAEKE